MGYLENFTLEDTISAYEKTMEVTGDNGEHCYSPIDEITLIFLKELKTYRDAEEQGSLIKLPCKVGDTVYCIEKRRTKCTAYDEEYRESSCLGCESACDSKVYYEVVETEAYGVGWILSNKKEFGKLIFLTKEEAEQKLAEMKGV